MNTLLYPHVTCVWGDISIGLGMRVRAFKPSCEAFQASGECTDHLHHVHHTKIIISTSWWLNSPSPLVISWSSWPSITCILQCSKLMTIGSGVSLKSIVITHMVCSRTSLWLWKWFCSSFRLDYWLVTGFILHPLVNYNLFLLNLCLLHGRGNYNRLFGLHKLHLFEDIHNWTTFSEVS